MTRLETPAVRAARPEELPELEGLRREAAGAAQALAGRDAARLVARGALLLARDEEGLAAGAILSALREAGAAVEGPGGETFFVHGLRVAERLVGQGLELRLLATLGALARREGATRLQLACTGSGGLAEVARQAGMAPARAAPGEAPAARSAASRRLFVARLEGEPADALGAAPLPLAEPVPRIPPPARRTEAPLPPYRYVPGRAPHPTRHPAGHASGAEAPAPAQVDAARLAAAPHFLRGADLFDAAYWWEAHEAWEALWVALGRRGPEADALRGLIQVAAACLKRFLGEVATAGRLAERGLGALERLPPGLAALDGARLARQVRRFVAPGEAPPPTLPLAGPAAPGEGTGDAAAARADAAPCR